MSQVNSFEINQWPYLLVAPRNFRFFFKLLSKYKCKCKLMHIALLQQQKSYLQANQLSGTNHRAEMSEITTSKLNSFLTNYDTGKPETYYA